MSFRYAFRQIESSPRNEPANNWCPAPSTIPLVKVEATGPVVDPATNSGQHATAVAGFLTGQSSPAAQACTDIFIEHSSYFKVTCLGDARQWTPSVDQPVSPWPKLQPYDNDPNIRIVINCSFGDNVSRDGVTGSSVISDQNTFNRLRDYLAKTNQVCCAALPDVGMLYYGGYLQNFPGYSQDVIAVGSADFGHESPDGRVPDCVAYGYTSLACPQVAAIALRLIYEHDKAGVSYTRARIKDLILRGCVQVKTPYTQGAGAVNWENTFALFKKELGATNAGLPMTIQDANFTTPNVGTGQKAYQYNPTGSPWTFSGGAGLAGNGSDFTIANDHVGQVAFIQNIGSITQSLTLEAGTYAYAVKWSKRAVWGQANTLDVMLGARAIQTIKADSGSGYQVSAGSFSLSTKATVQMSLVGRETQGDATVFIAQFTVSAPTDDDRRKAMAQQYGGVYDVVNKVYAIPSDKIIDFATALGLSGL